MRKAFAKNKQRTVIKWKTPLSEAQQIYFWHMLSVGDKLHFFFTSVEKKIHVMTIPVYCPYRIYTADMALDIFGEKCHFHPRKIKSTVGTWIEKNKKIFNAIQKGQPLSYQFRKTTEEIDQYLIVTNSDWIEFTAYQPLWQSYASNNFNFKKLMDRYMSKRSESFLYQEAKEKLKGKGYIDVSKN